MGSTSDGCFFLFASQEGLEDAPPAKKPKTDQVQARKFVVSGGRCVQPGVRDVGGWSVLRECIGRKPCLGGLKKGEGQRRNRNTPAPPPPPPKKKKEKKERRKSKWLKVAVVLQDRRKRGVQSYGGMEAEDGSCALGRCKGAKLGLAS